jgi:tetratricopeptide (TPR) repeat protein/CHAT domain-containing protein
VFLRPNLPAVVLAVSLAGAGALAGPTSAQTTQPSQAARPAAALAPAEAERIFTELLQRFFEAYVAKDIEGMAACSHPGGPAWFRRSAIRVEFDLRQVSMTALTVRNASADAGGGKSRAILDLAVTDVKTGRSRPERRVRDFTFLPDEHGVWKVWNETSPAGELARQVMAVPPEQRDAFISSQPELASEDTLAGLTTEAGRLQSQGTYDQVLEVLSAQARLARALGNQDALGRNLVQTGSLRMMTGRYAEAGEAFNAARDAYASSGNTEEVAACDANLGNLAYMQGRLAEAFERYDRAYAVFESLNDDARMVSTLHGMGNACYMQSDFTRALTYYTRALTVSRRTRDRYGEANVLQALALVHKELGDYAAAADVWRQTLALTEAGTDPAGSAKAYAGLGEVYRLQGDLARALQHQSKALEIWQRLKNAGATAAAHFAIGQLYATERNFPRALESYGRALVLDLAIADDQATSESGQARELGGMAGAHFAMGQPDVARGEYERSLALREKLKDEPGVMWTLAHLGVLHASQQRPEEAFDAYERSLSIAEARPDPNAISTVLALRAQLEFDQGRDDAAQASAARAWGIALGIDHFDTVMYAKLVAGRVLQKAGKSDEARASYEDAIAALEKVPVGPATETFFDNRRAPFVALVDLFASLGNRAEAFRWSERGRLEALADLLGGDGTVVSKGLSAAERDQERAIGKDLRALAARVRRERGRAKPEAVRLASLQEELTAKQAERDRLRGLLYEKHPALRDLRAQGEPARAEVAARVLGASRGVLVSFVVIEARTWAFAIARDSAGTWGIQKMVPIEVKAADLGGQVRSFREAIARKDGRAEDLGKELFFRLLDPLEPVLSGKTRLVVIPDAFLWSLPFEALVTPEGRFLVENASVAYGPSLTALVALAATPTPTSARTLTSFGQPILTAAIEERLALVRQAPVASAAAPSTPAGAPPARATAAAPAATSSADSDRPVTPPPAAIAPRPADPEVQAFASLFVPVARQVYTGDQARPDRLAPGVAPGTLLHLAVPAVLTEAAPLFTPLAFTPADGADPSTGIVEAYSLMSVTLPAETVVASRVEYGPASGEGDAITALAWVLFVAGSPTLVLDRWVTTPPDPNVAVRFVRFHVASAGAAARAATSMQKGMKAILSQPATRQPYYWAGYLVIGR